MAIRIGLITTLNTNIGDDLIRQGICLVLEEFFKGQHVQFITVNKHRPMTVYRIWHPIRWTEILPRPGGLRTRVANLVGTALYRLGFSLFDDCDIIVQCGTPVLWPGCHRCEWAEILWHQVVGRLSRRIPVLNLAAGSCYPWEHQPRQITDSNDAQYLQVILGYCQLTTVRDELAQRLCASLDVQVPMIPCSAFLAARKHDPFRSDQDNGLVLINYMTGGGHYEWEQGIELSAWYNTVRKLIYRLQGRHKLAFLCHNESEYNLVLNLDSTLPRIWPKTPQEYFTLVSEAKAALCNRMHASVGLASLGIPSVAVGTDTRLLMVKALGLPSAYVKEMNVDQLEDMLENLIKHRGQERERLLALKSETRKEYLRVVFKAIERDY